jgi:transcriptional regulator with XRE-family HTH domain
MPRKTIRNVLDLARLTLEHAAEVSQLEANLRRRQMIKKMMAMRAAKDLSQSAIAERMGVTQSKISKLEASDDEALNLGDFRSYLAALGFDLRMMINPKDWRPMDHIQCYANAIRGVLNQMVESARTGDAVRNAQEHHIETLSNMVTLIVESAKMLPNLSVEVPTLLMDDMLETTAIAAE